MANYSSLSAPNGRSKKTTLNPWLELECFKAASSFLNRAKDVVSNLHNTQFYFLYIRFYPVLLCSPSQKTFVAWHTTAILIYNPTRVLTRITCWPCFGFVDAFLFALSTSTMAQFQPNYLAELSPEHIIDSLREWEIHASLEDLAAPTQPVIERIYSGLIKHLLDIDIHSYVAHRKIVLETEHPVRAI